MEGNSLLALEDMSQPVKKGSVLGPLLFQTVLIHINDLQNVTSHSVLNFADNTMLYKTFTKTHTQMTVKNLIQN